MQVNLTSTIGMSRQWSTIFVTCKFAVVIQPIIYQTQAAIGKGSLDKCIMVWNFKPELRAFRFAGHKAAVYSVDFSPSNGIIASGSKDRSVRIWEPTVKGNSSILKAHTGTVRCVKFSSDGRMLLTASDDKTVKVWSVPSQKFKFTLTGHMNWVRACSFSPDCRLAASGGDDKTVRVWDLHSKKQLTVYDDHLGNINVVAYHPDGTCIASAGTDHSIKIWDIRSNQLIQHYNAHNGPITDLAFHPSGSFLLTSSHDKLLKIFDLREGQPFFTIHGHEGAANAVCFSPAGDYFSSAGADEQVMVWKTNFDRDLEDYVLSYVQRNDQDLAPINCSQKQQLLKKDNILSDVSNRVESHQVATEEHVTNVVPFTENRLKSPIHAWKEDQPESKKVCDMGEDKEEGGVSPGLASTLQHIVGQLDMLAETISIVEDRLTMNENRLLRIEETLKQSALTSSLPKQHTH